MSNRLQKIDHHRYYTFRNNPPWVERNVYIFLPNYRHRYNNVIYLVGIIIINGMIIIIKDIQCKLYICVFVCTENITELFARINSVNDHNPGWANYNCTWHFLGALYNPILESRRRGNSDMVGRVWRCPRIIP